MVTGVRGCLGQVRFIQQLQFKRQLRIQQVRHKTIPDTVVSGVVEGTLVGDTMEPAQELIHGLRRVLDGSLEHSSLVDDVGDWAKMSRQLLHHLVVIRLVRVGVEDELLEDYIRLWAHGIKKRRDLNVFVFLVEFDHEAVLSEAIQPVLPSCLIREVEASRWLKTSHRLFGRKESL